MKEKSGALRCLCCRCRSVQDAANVACGQSGLLSAFDQLLKVVGALSKKVGEMASELEGISNGRVGSRDQTVGRDASREAMRSELKELQEQERRQCSIILRGF